MPGVFTVGSGQHCSLLLSLHRHAKRQPGQLQGATCCFSQNLLSCIQVVGQLPADSRRKPQMATLGACWCNYIPPSKVSYRPEQESNPCLCRCLLQSLQHTGECLDAAAASELQPPSGTSPAASNPTCFEGTAPSLLRACLLHPSPVITYWSAVLGREIWLGKKRDKPSLRAWHV